MISYTPKAAVQAAIGAIPLSTGLSCRKIFLTATVPLTEELTRRGVRIVR